MKFKNLLLGIKSQNFNEFLITKNAWGLFNKNSHINKITKKEKIGYSSKEKAWKAANAMSQKYNEDFSAYKCIFCDNWHIGKNR